jgi:hypothetical protein
MQVWIAIWGPPEGHASSDIIKVSFSPSFKTELGG